jgi:hypothetical protein
MKWTAPVFWTALTGVGLCLVMTIVTAVRTPAPGTPPPGAEAIPLPATTQ